MNKSTEAKVDNLIASLWQRHLPALRERLAILDRTATEASSGSLAEPARAEALSIAHKLAGNLGMYGHAQGSVIASEMEKILKTPDAEKLPRLTDLSRQLRETLSPSM